MGFNSIKINQKVDIKNFKKIKNCKKGLKPDFSKKRSACQKYIFINIYDSVLSMLVFSFMLIEKNKEVFRKSK